jgi:hypothetical protein
MPALYHSFHHPLRANRSVLARCSNRRFTPAFHDGQLQLLPRCPASVQHPGNPPANRLGLPHARASLRCPRLTAAEWSDAISPLSVRILAAGCRVCSLLPPGFPAVPHEFLPTSDVDTMQTSRRKTQNLRCVNAGWITHPPPRMEDFVVACPLVPGGPTPPIRFLFVAPPLWA